MMKLKEMRKRDEPIALCWENMYAVYEASKPPCDLNYAGEFHPSFTSWAIKKGHKMRPAIDDALKKLNETGQLTELRAKWWKSSCVEKTKTTSGSDRIALVTFDTIVFVLVLSMTSLY